MEKFPNLLILFLAVSFVLTTSMLGSAEGIGTVIQVGFDNYTYVYQEVLSEAIILQLGDRNKSSVEQVGSVHLAGVAQLGEDNFLHVQQLGQRDLVFSIQFGADNYANISQVHSASWEAAYKGISDNDAFSYQSGLYNTLNLRQIGNDNAVSITQQGLSNRVSVFQTGNHNAFTATQG